MTDKVHSELGWALVLCLLVLTAAEFLIRGPVRFVFADNFNDFLSPYIQTRAWIKGLDPYSPQNLAELWPAAERFDFLSKDLADGSLVKRRGIPTAYPPTSFVLLTTVAWLPWRVACPVWLSISLLAFATMVLSLASLTDFAWSERRTYLFLGLALALAPFHTGLAAGSIVIVVVGACSAAVWAANRQHDVMAGVLIGVAVGLKPQIGLPFLLYYLLRRRWPILIPATVTVILLASVAIGYMEVNHALWVDNYQSDNRVLFAPGSLGDFTESNPIRFGLINLQVLTYAITSDRSRANVLAVAVTGVLALFWLIVFRRSCGRNELLTLGALTVLTLLPVYHRFYDASLLIFPLTWGLEAWSSQLKMFARGTVLLILIFLVPGGTILQQLEHMNFGVSWQHSWWWTQFVMTHEIWALLFLSTTLLLAMRFSQAYIRKAT